MVHERFSWDVVTQAYRTAFRRFGLGSSHILIATPQFPPDIGGPGRYAEKLAEALGARGVVVSIVTYGSWRHPPATLRDIRAVAHHIPSGLKHLLYFWRALGLLRRAKIALVFDPVIVGLPLVIAAALLRKPIIFRVEGDFLWEWYIERTHHDLTLSQFYERFPEVREHLGLKERLMYRLARFTCRRAHAVAFSSVWRRDIFLLGYAPPSRSAIIAPPWPTVGRGRVEREPVLLFAGRFIRVKNLERLIRAFAASMRREYRLELIGDGPEKQNLESSPPSAEPRASPEASRGRARRGRGIHNLGPQGRVVIRPPLGPQALRDKIASAHAFLLPSLSEVSPNIILECLAVGTPFLLTRETGFYETLKDIGLFVNPLDEDDISDKIRILADPAGYEAYQKRLKGFSLHRSWEAVAEEWLNLIRSILP